MFIIKNISAKHKVLNLTFSRLQCVNRRFQVFAPLTNHKLNEANNLRALIEKYEDKILYSSFVEGKRLRFGFKRNAAIVKKHVTEERKRNIKLQSLEPLPISLKYYCDVKENEPDAINEPQRLPTDFPFQKTDGVVNLNDASCDGEFESHDDAATIADIEVKSRLRLLKNSPNNWMTDYENFDDEVTNELEWKINYGTPDSRSNVSLTPCGGCGAFLHCKDTSIPGYIPSEIFKNHRNECGTDLKGVICQRCYFLQNYNLALQVRVSTEDYPRVLQTIGDRKRALVILMVDLLDFPCSIWPGVADLLGKGRSIFVVGNKIDLLPQDGKGFLKRVSSVLEKGVRETGFAMTDIKHIALISAKTGFGVEDLITKLHSFWQYNGDVFLVGCTNVGKSSLFNALMQSDYCKVQAVDLIQRATTSLWPGTTLNLLKFPIMRPTGWKLQKRRERLNAVNKEQNEENKLRKSQLRKTKNSKYATLIGHLDRTFVSLEPVEETDDPFAVGIRAEALDSNKFGINENDKMFALSKWCYDTPGVVQSDQIIHFLTTDELMLTLPKQLLRPQTFILYPGTSVFIAGLGRLDYVDGTNFARFTVFCSSSLPITICCTDVADDMYDELLRTEFFAVPINDPARLKLWPGLKGNRAYTVKGVDWTYSCADVVLSNAGWIAITCGPDMECKLKAWAPERSGVHLRESLLPKAVSLRGKRIRDSPAYKTDRFYIQK